MTSSNAVDSIHEENAKIPENLEPWKMFTSDLVTKTEPEDTYVPESMETIEGDDSLELHISQRETEDNIDFLSNAACDTTVLTDLTSPDSDSADEGEGIEILRIQTDFLRLENELLEKKVKTLQDCCSIARQQKLKFQSRIRELGIDNSKLSILMRNLEKQNCSLGTRVQELQLGNATLERVVETLERRR